MLVDGMELRELGVDMELVETAVLSGVAEREEESVQKEVMTSTMW